ncbi:MAG TPA: hypothetical protein VL177_04335 [Terriglobales bacterium]|nr:hypothetical protein [Terriglobales bacterium]
MKAARPTPATPPDPRLRTIILVGYIAGFASLIAFLWYFRHNQVLLYGDAVAHINIARRVFDSRTPGLKQLGTVWLPLPHLLIIPFIFSDWSWQTGLGGSWPFMIAYVAGAIGIFRLVRDGLAPSLWNEPAPWPVRLAPWFAALIFAANPNLLYMQSTAMTETLYLALFVWAVIFLADFIRQRYSPDLAEQANAGGSLVRCGICLALSMLTRYDGWFAACVFLLVVVLLLLRREPSPQPQPRLRRSVLIFAALLIAVPAFWFAYNAAIYGDPLDFARGPYSARGIEQRTSKPGEARHPGYHSLSTAAIFFVKSAELNQTEGPLERPWLALAATGIVLLLAYYRRLGAWLLLLIPLPFYALSIAYGGVPIFMPMWWPFSFYNVRYGLQLVPAFAVFFSFLLHWGLQRISQQRWQITAAIAAFAFVGASYGFAWHAQPICLQEAVANARTRVAFERSLAEYLRFLPPNSTFLMYIGGHVGALQDAGIHLSRVIHEGNHGDPSIWGKEGMWQRALADPAKYADYAIGFDDDEVTKSAEAHHYPALLVIHTVGQPAATIFGTHPPYPGMPSLPTR